MPRRARATNHDPEFRRRVLELVRTGRPVPVVAAELGLAEATVYGGRPKTSSTAE
jgi:transposase-like protein